MKCKSYTCYKWNLQSVCKEPATGPMSRSRTESLSAGPIDLFLISPQQSNKTYSCHAATESCYIFKPPTSSVSVSFFNLESRVLIDLSVMWHDCNRDNQQLAGKKIVFLFSSPLLWGVSQSSVGDGCSHQFYRLLSFEGFLVTPDLLLQCAQVDNLDFVFYWFCSIGT